MKNMRPSENRNKRKIDNENKYQPDSCHTVYGDCSPCFIYFRLEKQQRSHVKHHEEQLRAPLYPPVHYSTIVMRDLMGFLNWASIMQ